MAKQEIDIGVEGNDGTGDSIRESFKKVNENFNELYAVFGLGGQIGFTNLNDTPESTAGQEGKVLLVNQQGTGIDFYELVSNAGTADPTDTTNTVAFEVDGNKLKFKVINTNIESDPSPALPNPLKMDAAIAYSETTHKDVLRDTQRQGLINQWNAVHELPNIDEDNIIISKGLADRKYQPKEIPGMGTRMRDEPADASAYTYTIDGYNGTLVQITAHGFTEEVSGSGYVYEATITDAANLTTGVTYYVRREDANFITLHPTSADALNDTNRITADFGVGVQTLTDAAWDDSLEGFYLSEEALPRNAIVRRQGDTMTGALTAHDHPAPYAGAGIVNSADDLQVATKYYVDAQFNAISENIYVSTKGTDDHTGTPPGLEGRSENYAFRSILAATQKAARIQEASPVDLGPYIQTLTYTESLVTNNSYVRSLADSGYSIAAGDKTTVVNTIDTNTFDLIDRVIDQIAIIFPDFVYDETTCRRDLELIINSVKFDISATTNAASAVNNRLSRTAGLRYFANPSGEIAIDAQGQRAQTIYAITYAKNEMLDDIETAGVAASTIWHDAVESLWDTVLDTIDTNTADPSLVESDNYYKVYVHSGANGFTDQSGDPNAALPNVDIFPGKVIRGKRSGAIGTVISYTRGDDDLGSPDYDTMEVDLLEPIEFLENEEIEYGAFVKKRQISIRVESGTYEEQLPIRLPENISIKGDEFRRVLIRPARGPSLSPMVNTWFYRDEFVDGLTTATGGTDEWIDDLTGLRRGFFGYHYLIDPANPWDISDFGTNNIGGYIEAADLIRFNKDFIIEDVIAYINLTYPAPFVYDEAKCRRDTGFIVDGIVKDLKAGGRSFSAENQKAYYSGAVAGQETETEDAILHIKSVITGILANDPLAPYSVTTGNTETQVFNDGFEAETGAETQALELVDLVAYAFDANYNPAKDNNEMDMFLCGDNTIVRNVTAQRHGGFMMVLDPEGSIRTRSPYAQTNSSFARSLNRKAFHGGMFIDGYTYNMPMTITSKDDFFTLNVEAPIGSGLNIRKPELPCSFFEYARRYQVNAITNYREEVSELDGVTLVQKATLILDLGSHDGIGFDDDIDSAGGPVDIILQGAGNKSMLANDYTQINDLGYGVIATNNALSELVSVFTYYAHTGYLALNGSQIRSLTGNNSYGFFGLVAEGSDPDEIATQVTLAQDMTMPVKIYVVDQELELSGTGLGISRGDILRQYNTTTELYALAEVVFAYTEGANTIVAVKRYVDANTLQENSFNTVDTITNNTTIASTAMVGGTEYVIAVPGSTDFTNVGAADNNIGTTFTASAAEPGTGTVYSSYGAPVSVSTTPTTGTQGQAFAYIFDTTQYAMNASQLEIHHTDNEESFQPYEVVSVSETNIEIPADYLATDVAGPNTDINYKVYRCDFTSGTGGDAATENTGLAFNVDYGTYAVLTAQQNLLLNGVDSATLTRPSTALIFEEQEQTTYRTLGFENTVVGAVQVTGLQSRVTTDDNFDYVDLTINNNFTDHAVGSYSLTGGTTLGDTLGDIYIAVNKLNQIDADRINNGDIDMIFSWYGRQHIITSYQDVTDAEDGTNVEFGIITINDAYDIIPGATAAGITKVLTSTNNITLQAGLQEAAVGNVTVNISTCRATSHDFLDIGTGGYNTSNYPDRIFGVPVERPVTSEESIDSLGNNSKAQVQERRRGRVFFASTDQDGFFRVGRFFTVDQGTGRITFNAALVLTNIDGIGFKRGVRVNEFSADDTFSNAQSDTVPVETAVEGYINRRLGWDRNGTVLGSADIIPANTGGALALSGVTVMRGDLRMGGNQITNLALPTTGTDGANKDYVDAQVAAYDEFSELRDTDINDTTALANNHFAIYDSVLGKWINAGFDTGDNGGTPAIPNSDVLITKNGSGDLIGAIQANSIVNADINSEADIQQSKLLMERAPIFDEDDITTGWDSVFAGKSIAMTQDNMGITAFSDNNFEIEQYDFGDGLGARNTGRVRIKAEGIDGNTEIAANSIPNSRLSNRGITFQDGSGTGDLRELGETLVIQGTSNEISVNHDGAGTYTIGLTANFETDVTGDIYTGLGASAVLVLENGTATGGVLDGNQRFYGLSDRATDIDIDEKNDNTTYQVTFSAQNGTGYQRQYIDTDNSHFTYNPSTHTLTVGTADVNTGMNIAGNIIPDSGTPTNQNIGSSTNRWGTIYGSVFNGTATEALYADLAENYLGDATYEPGTVLVFGGEQEVTVTNKKGDSRVAGVVTTNPAHLMNSALQGDHVVGLALQGRVPVKVLGKVQKGDMLVTAAKAGHAIVDNSPGIGQVIGKAVTEKTDDGYGIVEVVVGRV